MAKTKGKYVEISDRKEAIRYVIEHGQKGDVIVLAGKGHEDYQEIEGVKHHFLDRETFVLNGTGENRLVLRVHAAPRRVQAFDTFGKEVPAPSLAVGVNEVPVPCSGYLRIAY